MIKGNSFLMNVLVHAHIPQKLQNISEHFDMRYAILWHTLKYMFISIVLLFTYSRAVQYGYNESAGMWSLPITTTKF